MRRNKNTTPYTITAKYGGTCGCKKAIREGDKVLYYPASRKVECLDCARRTLDALADERMMG